MKLFSQCLIILACIFASTAYASRSGYEVEVIIFEDAKSRYLSSEDWAFNDNLNQSKNNEVSLQPDSDKEFQLLPWENSKLTKQAEKIQKNPNYNILLKKRWKQTGLDRDVAFQIPVNIFQTPSNNETATSESDSQAILDGYIKLIMSRYLHFQVNMKYYKPVFENGEENFKLFPVVSERRMKSKEVHYIDHPLLGIIILATPYKIKDNLDKKSVSEHKILTQKTL